MKGFRKPFIILSGNRNRFISFFGGQKRKTTRFLVFGGRNRKVLNRIQLFGGQVRKVRLIFSKLQF